MGVVDCGATVMHLLCHMTSLNELCGGLRRDCDVDSPAPVVSHDFIE